MTGRVAIIWLISVFLCVPSGAQEDITGSATIGGIGSFTQS